MLIEVWSDVVCPWCFIGKRRLEKAIAKLPDPTKVEVRHRAFQLQPDIDGVVSTSDYLSRKYRISPAEVEKMQANVCSIADGEGLCYDLSETLSGNTADAHRLILWAEEIGKGDELLEVIYSAYFEKKQSIFTNEDLIALASSIGINGDEAKALLQSDRFADQVNEDQDLARQLGANGVPFYVIEMKFGISGAQPQEHFDSIFTTLKG